MKRFITLIALAITAVFGGWEIAKTCQHPPCLATSAAVCSLESRSVPTQALAFTVDLDLVYHNASITCPQAGGSITVNTLSVVQNDTFLDAIGFSFIGFPATPFNIAAMSSIKGKLRVFMPAGAVQGCRRFDVSLSGVNNATMTPVSTTCFGLVFIQGEFRVEALGGIQCGYTPGTEAHTIYRITNLAAVARTFTWGITSSQISTSTINDHFPISLCGTAVPCGDPASTINPTLSGAFSLPATIGSFFDICVATRSFPGCHSCSSNNYDFTATDQLGNMGKARWNYTTLAVGWGGIGVETFGTDFAAGGGGVIPQTPSGGGGVWPNTLPPTTAWFQSTATVPSGWTGIAAVQIYNLTHTWIGDLQFVLISPSGQGFNLVHRPGFTGTGVGSNGDRTGGTYTIVDPSTAGAATVPLTGNWVAGTYQQSFGAGAGTWPTGVNNIFNQPMNGITPIPGTWTLRILDWASGDVGTCTGWAIKGMLPATPATPYCTAGVTTNGCVPQIMGVGWPSATQTSGFYICAGHLEGQKQGLLFYGVSGQIAVLWGGTSYLCVKAPTQRMPVQSTGGTTNGCDGGITQDWNMFMAMNPLALGNPLAAGQVIDAQAWFRDPPSPKTTNLSDALEFIVQP